MIIFSAFYFILFTIISEIYSNSVGLPVHMGLQSQSYSHTPTFLLDLLFLGKFAISPIAMALSVSLRLSVCVTFVRSRRILAKNKKRNKNIYRFWNFPSNDVIAKILHRDLDLLYNWNVEAVRASAKMHGATFLNFDICHRRTTLKNCTPQPWPAFWR